jgi:hypothetical protein
MPAVAVLAVAVGLVVGSALAPLPYTKNDECLGPADSYLAPGAEGVEYGASLDVWPLRLRCEYDVGGGRTRSLLVGPGVVETLGWSALIALLTAAVLRDRRSAALRGALLAACFLAPVVVGLLYSEFVLACWVAVMIGVPAVLALGYALRAPDERQTSRSILVAGGLSAVVFFACFVCYFAGYGRAGIAAGIVAGGLIARQASRRRSTADLNVSCVG